MDASLTLYSYWRSSAAYRVRIGLNLKQLDYVIEPVHLVRDGGEQRGEAYRALNPQALVPALVHGDRVLTQSLAILEYIDEIWPQPAPLLPASAVERARVRALAQLVACDIHPLNNLRVLQYLKREHALEQDAIDAWMRHWMQQGFAAMEQLLATTPGTGAFCHGDAPGLADACLVPQLYNARRFALALDDYPTLTRIEAACLALPAFEAARPENQPDAA
ncbi:maleylacetoacetate isomerase [Luteimonas sp. e5]